MSGFDSKVIPALAACLVGTSAGLARADLPIERLANWGGDVRAVAVHDNVVYMGSGPRMLVVDVSDANTPVEVGSIYLHDIPLSIEVQGDYAYVASQCGDHEFAVVRISDPGAPSLAGWYHESVQGCDHRSAVAPAGNIVYLGHDSGILVMDVSDPDTPTPVFDLNQCDEEVCWGMCSDLELSGNVLYAPDWRHFRAVDVSDPYNPEHISSVPIPPSPGGMDLAGNLAFVTHEDGLSIIDVTNPQNMEVVGIYPLDYAPDVAVAGQYAYVAAGALGLLVLDVFEPESPTLVTSLTTHAAVIRVTLNGTTAYLGDTGEGMIVADVSNPSQPIRKGNHHSPEQIDRVTVRDNLLYIADYFNGVSILDLTERTNPQLVGIWQTGWKTWEVVLRGDRAFVGAGEPGLEILDISDPTSPTYVGGYFTGGAAMGVGLKGDLAVVGQWSPGPVRLLDISNEEQPVLLETIWWEAVRDVEFGSDHAFMSRVNTLLVTDISDPQNPTVCYNLPPEAHDTHLQGDLLFVAADEYDGPEGLAVLDVSDPCSPEEIAWYTPAGGGAHHFLGVVVVGRRAYCAGAENHGLHIVDVGDPLNPTFLAEYDTPSYAHQLAVDEPYVYVSDGYGGVIIFRVPAQGDADQDWDVDLIDYDLFLGCRTGPVGGVLPGCEVFDFYNVGAGIDMIDYQLLLDNFTGSQ